MKVLCCCCLFPSAVVSLIVNLYHCSNTPLLLVAVVDKSNRRSGLCYSVIVAHSHFCTASLLSSDIIVVSLGQSCRLLLSFPVGPSPLSAIVARCCVCPAPLMLSVNVAQCQCCAVSVLDGVNVAQCQCCAVSVWTESTLLSVNAAQYQFGRCQRCSVSMLLSISLDGVNVAQCQYYCQCS